VRLFDSHAHLTDESFGAELDGVLARAVEAGVESVASIASGLEDARAAAELARRSTAPRVLATAGVHPHEAGCLTPDALSELEAVAGAEPVAAIGETGLDFHHERGVPREAQIDAFRSQMELAERLGLPVVVHSRDADFEVAGVVDEFAGRVVGVLHCFTGGAVLLDAALRADWYVSFSGIVTFKNFAGAEGVRRVPADRLLVETDSPYLAPAPFRGRRNEPAFVRYVVDKVAELRGEDPGRVAEVTYENACRFYGRGS
jgi:TatD DNase family protein